MQDVASLLPCVAEYLPATHLTHTVDDVAPELLEYVPALHRIQSRSSLLPVVGAYLPAKHALQVVDPEVDEYLPLPQCVQADEPACMQNIRRFSIILMLCVSGSGDMECRIEHMHTNT